VNEETALRIRQTFDRLRRGGRPLTDIDQALMDAFERLMHGLSETTDGKITIVNVCTEAEVSRASYYRSPVAQAVKEILEAPQTRRPEPEELRAEVSRLKKAERELRSEHASEVRELKDTLATYANQIQVLTLRNAELETEHARLLERLRQSGDNVVVLPAPSPSSR
jgi:small-conductance mechanosensitive channel